MSEIVRLEERPEACLDGRLRPPDISAELAERSVARLTRVRLGERTVNTCNPGIGDVDGDGLDEIAVAFNRGEQDVVALFRGDGSTVWETTDVPFYHSFYDDDELYVRSHWHYRTNHRHLLTKICDIDGDGRLEVIVGLGPLCVLDAQTGELKRTFDLDGLAQVWDLGHLLTPDGWCIAAGVNHHERSGSILALDAEGRTIWQHETPGKSFEDKLLCGDLTGDGLDEIAFSMADAERFEVRKGNGELLWAKSVPDEIGEDTHVDDMVIAEIQPGGRQLATSTGGCLFDADGTLLWSVGDRIEHGQKISLAYPPGHDGARLFVNSKTGRKAWLLTPEGEILWEYGNWSSCTEGTHLLTTAGDWGDWSATGSCEIIQSEVMSWPAASEPAQAEPLTMYITILDADGQEIAKLPYQEALAPGFNGAMCCLACHATTRDRHDIVLITHSSGELLIFSPL